MHLPVVVAAIPVVVAVAMMVVVIAIGLFLMFRGQTTAGYDAGLAAGVAIAFLMGVAASYTAGYVGMGMAVNGNQRTAHQARYPSSLRPSIRRVSVAMSPRAAMTTARALRSSSLAHSPTCPFGIAQGT